MPIQTHKNNRDGSKNHDRPSLLNALSPLPKGLLGLHYTCLLLFDGEKLINLFLVSLCELRLSVTIFPQTRFVTYIFHHYFSGLIQVLKLSQLLFYLGE